MVRLARLVRHAAFLFLPDARKVEVALASELAANRVGLGQPGPAENHLTLRRTSKDRPYAQGHNLYLKQERK